MRAIYPTYSTVDVFNSTYKMVSEIELHGAIVECGVAAGSNFAQMIKASMDKGIHRKYYGFDSFEGIPYGTIEDEIQPGTGLPIDVNLKGSSGVTVHDIRGVEENLKEWGVWSDDVILVKGLFEDTIPVNDIDKIAVLRLDGDLYLSTKVCLEHLYPKVQKGGLIIIDDYALPGCYKAVNEFIEGKGITLLEYDYIRYWFK